MFVTTNCVACGRVMLIDVEHFNTRRVAFHLNAGQRCSNVAGNDVGRDELHARLVELEKRTGQ